MKKWIIEVSFVLSCLICNAQTWSPSIRVGYEFINSMTISSVAPQTVIVSDNTLYSGYAIVANADICRLSNRCSFGGHIGFSPSGFIKPYSNDASNLSGDLIACLGVHYGIDLHFALMSNMEKMDINLNGTLGSYWAPHISPQVEYGIGISATYYMLRNWGIFVETGWGSYYYTSSFPQIFNGHTIAKAGISYRF